MNERLLALRPVVLWAWLMGTLVGGLSLSLRSGERWTGEGRPALGRVRALGPSPLPLSPLAQGEGEHFRPSCSATAGGKSRVVIARAAIIVAILGAVIAAYFIHKGPSVTTPSTALRWTSAAIDGGEIELQFSKSGVDFLRVHDVDEPILAINVLRRGSDSVLLPDTNWFLDVVEDEGRLWAFAESTTEGPGPSIDVLVSEDQGKTFELRASVPKPNYQAMFERCEVQGQHLTLQLSLDDETPLSDDWVWPWWRVEWPGPFSRPVFGPGSFRIRSKNGGRSWRLER